MRQRNFTQANKANSRSRPLQLFRHNRRRNFLIQLVTGYISTRLYTQQIRGPSRRFLTPRNQRNISPRISKFTFQRTRLSPPILQTPTFKSIRANRRLRPHDSTPNRLGQQLNSFTRSTINARTCPMVLFVEFRIRIKQTTFSHIRRRLISRARRQHVINILPNGQILIFIISQFSIRTVRIGINRFLRTTNITIRRLLSNITRLIILSRGHFNTRTNTRLSIISHLVINQIKGPRRRFVTTPPRKRNVILTRRFLTSRTFKLNFLVRTVGIRRNRTRVLQNGLHSLAATRRFILRRMTSRQSTVTLNLRVHLLHTFIDRRFNRRRLLNRTTRNSIIR